MAEWLCSGLQLRVHRFDSVLSLHGMKILITGSSGFIGYHLARRLLKEGHMILGVDNHNDYYNVKLKELRKKELSSQNYKFLFLDINDMYIANQGFDIAINLAAQAGVRVPVEKQHLYKETNINGFKSFIKFCLLNNIRNVIYASSSSVYSDEGNKKFSESNTQLSPKSKYGASKLENEIYASDISKNEDLSIMGLRFFSVYGPYGRPDMAYYSFTDAIKNGKTLHLNNEGNMYRDMTYIDDIIDGIYGAMNYMINSKNKIKNEIINLGNDYPIKTYDLLESLQQKLNKTTKIINIKTSNEAYRTHADISKARNLLSYSPKVSFDEGIKKFLEWHKCYENI